MKVLYVGSFSPYHNGHHYVYTQLKRKFGVNNVYLGVAINPNKKNDLNAIRRSLVPITKNVLVYDGLTSTQVLKENFDFLVRGIRNEKDLQDETALSYWNRELCGVETLYIIAPPQYSMLSSSAIKELHYAGASVDQYVSDEVFLRWRHPARMDVYFGKCCCGKSTYIKKECTKGMFDPYANNKEIIEMDKLFWTFSTRSDEGISLIIPAMRKAFYEKSNKFYDIIEDVMEKFDWEKFCKEANGKIVDFPAIGVYWEYIPTYVKASMNLIKVSTSEENRREFAIKRGVNPLLIECNDHFYVDPDYFDSEIIIEKDNNI